MRRESCTQHRTFLGIFGTTNWGGFRHLGKRGGGGGWGGGEEEATNQAILKKVARKRRPNYVPKDVFYSVFLTQYFQNCQQKGPRPLGLFPNPPWAKNTVVRLFVQGLTYFLYYTSICIVTPFSSSSSVLPLVEQEV